jgi:hypothetical protein
VPSLELHAISENYQGIENSAVTGINFSHWGKEENRKNLTGVNWAQATAWQHRAMIAAVQPNKGPTSQVMRVAKFERFFWTAAGLDVDK